MSGTVNQIIFFRWFDDLCSPWYNSSVCSSWDDPIRLRGRYNPRTNQWPSWFTGLKISSNLSRGNQPVVDLIVETCLEVEDTGSFGSYPGALRISCRCNLCCLYELAFWTMLFWGGFKARTFYLFKMCLVCLSRCLLLTARQLFTCSSVVTGVWNWYELMKGFKMWVWSVHA